MSDVDILFNDLKHADDFACIVTQEENIVGTYTHNSSLERVHDVASAVNEACESRIVRARGASTFCSPQHLVQLFFSGGNAVAVRAVEAFSDPIANSLHDLLLVSDAIANVVWNCVPCLNCS